MPEAPVVVQKAQVDIDLSGGIKQGSPEETSDWAKTLVEADNVLVDGNSLVSRPGVTGIGTLATSSGTTGAKLGVLDGKLAAINGSGSLFKIKESESPIGVGDNTFPGTGFMPSVSVSTTAAGSQTSVALPYAVVNLTKFKAILSDGTINGTAKGILTIMDATTNNIVKRYVGDGICNMVGVDDRYIHLYRYNPAGGILQCAIVDCNTVGSMPLDSSQLLFLWASTVTGTLTSADKLSGIVAVTNASIFITNGTSTTYIRKVSNSNTLTASTTLTDLDGGATGIDVDASGNIYIVGTYTVVTFTPTTLSLTGFWRDYTGSSPWAGTASAGGSGAQSLTEATNPPTAGTALNTHGTAAYNGTTKKIAGATLATFLTTTAYSGWMLINTTAVGTGTPTGGDGELLSDGTGVWGAGTRNSGGNKIFFQHFDSAWRSAEVALTTGTWTLFQFKLDSGNLRIRTDSNSWTVSAVSGALAATTGALDVGFSRPAFAKFFSGTIAEVGLANSVITDADFDNIKAYINTRYGLAL